MCKRTTTRAVAAAVLATGLAFAGCGGKEKGAEAPGETTAGDAQLTADAAGAGESQAAGEGEAEGEAAAAGAAEEKRAHCVRAIEHVMALVEERGAEISDEQREEALGEGAEHCARDATRAELDCVLAAGNVEDVEACGGGV